MDFVCVRGHFLSIRQLQFKISNLRICTSSFKSKFCRLIFAMCCKSGVVQYGGLFTRSSSRKPIPESTLFVSSLVPLNSSGEFPRLPLRSFPPFVSSHSLSMRWMWSLTTLFPAGFTPDADDGRRLAMTGEGVLSIRLSIAASVKQRHLSNCVHKERACYFCFKHLEARGSGECVKNSRWLAPIPTSRVSRGK
jgi:hypothetical protein